MMRVYALPDDTNRVDASFFFQAEDGIRDAQESRGLGDVYKRQLQMARNHASGKECLPSHLVLGSALKYFSSDRYRNCLLYTSDAADDLLCVDLGGRRIIQKKTHRTRNSPHKWNHCNFQHPP